MTTHSLNKPLISLLILLSTFVFKMDVNAQNKIPYGITYQAVANDENGEPIANSQLFVQINIKKGGLSGELVWQESHNVMTNGFGLFTLIIGKGTSTSQGTSVSFKKINWAEGEYFIKVQTDFGSGLKDMGSVELQSVPYSIIADSALHAPIPRLAHLIDVNKNGLKVNETLKWNGSQWVPADSLVTDYLFVTGDVLIGRNLKVNSDLYVADTISSTTVDAQKGDFDTILVNYNAFIENDLSVKNNVAITNDLFVNNNTSIQNNLLIGHNLVIQNDLKVNNNSFIKSDLYVTDSITATTVDADNGNFDNLILNQNASIGNNLDVWNSITARKYIFAKDDIFVDHDIYVSDSITATTVDASKGDFDNLLVNNNAVIQNNLNVNNSTTIQNDLIVNDNTHLNSDLYVTDSITATTIDANKGDFDTLLVDNNAYIENDLEVNNSAVIQNNLTVNNSTTIQNDLNVNDNTYLNSDLYVTDSITATTIDANKGDFDTLLIDNNAYIENNLVVNNSATVQNDLIVNDKAWINSDLYVSDTITATTVDASTGDFDNLLVNINAVIQNNLNVNNNTTIQNDLTVNNNTHLNSDLYVNDSITATTIDANKGDFDTLLIDNNAYIENNLVVNNSATVQNDLIVNDKSWINSDLYVSDSITANTVKAEKGDFTDIDIGNNVVIQNDLTITNDLKVNGVFGLLSGTTVNKISTDGSFGANSDDVLVTEKAIKHYISVTEGSLQGEIDVDSAYLYGRIVTNENEIYDDSVYTYNLLGASHGTVEADRAVIVDGNKDISGFRNMQIIGDVSINETLGFNTGTTIDNFSTNTSLSGNSDNNVPTERAVKTYVDDKTSNLSSDAVLRDGSQSLTADWNAAYNIRGNMFISDTTGAPPFQVSSDEVVQHLHADRIDSVEGWQLIMRDGSRELFSDWDAGSNIITAQQFESDVAFGTAPFIIASKTKVANLNADYVDGKTLTDFVLLDGSQPLTADWNASYNIQGNMFISDTTGAPPFQVSSDEVVQHLHADRIDTLEGWQLIMRDGSRELFSDWDVGSNKIIAETFESDVSLGTAPFIIASKTKVANLNAEYLDGKTLSDFMLLDGSQSMNSDLDMGNKKIINLKEPVDNKDAATKKYVDDLIALDSIWLKFDNKIYYNSSNVGIGIKDANATFHLKGSFLVEVTSDTVPVIGQGARMMWVPNKKAFRSGYVAGGHWDADSIGNFSFATGLNPIAKGDYSMALGNNTTASGNSSTAMGYGSIARGDYSTALGHYSKARGESSFSAGDGTIALGNYSTALGKNSKSSNSYSTSIGFTTISSGMYSTAIGNATEASGNASIAVGDHSKAIGDFSSSLGKFVTAHGNASSAFGDSSGAYGYASIAIGFRDTASGKFSRAIGYLSNANADFSTVLGDSSVASSYASIVFGLGDTARGNYSRVFGFMSSANGNNSTAIGDSLTASGFSSLAMGNGGSAIGNYSSSFGYKSKANANFSTTFGYKTHADTNYTFVIGKYNDTLVNTAFEVGNGIVTSASNALTLYENGNMTIAGTLTESSDLRFKKNIQPLENVLERLLTIQPVYYYFKNQRIHPSGKQLGVIAQEVNEVFPELVRKEDNGYYSVSYSKFSSVLIQAIKEQQQIIDEQKNKIKLIEDKYIELEERMNKLEDRN
ncbi:MAG: tail fiber domain-containing protein [Bacteroidota bacterium]|nr:tail fiber domain-containing protein [Bacteroidota bacterium]